MKLSYRLEGLCCANCANQIETKIQKLSTVKSVSLSYMTQKLIIEIEEENSKKTIEQILSIIKKIEPDVEIKKI